jgi:membrane associated rhomboid family serine protease
MIAQLLVSAQLERDMGTGGFFFVYFAAGIFGYEYASTFNQELQLTLIRNILGGNFSLVGLPSVGASGAIFGTVAVNWVDLLAHWKYQYKPRTKV